MNNENKLKRVLCKCVCMRALERVKNNSKRERNKKPAASPKCIKCMSNPNKCWLTIKINSCEKNAHRTLHKEVANRNGKRWTDWGRETARGWKLFAGWIFGNNCPRLKWISLNQTTDGYYFYVFDTMQSFSCQFIILILVLCFPLFLLAFPFVCSLGWLAG